MKRSEERILTTHAGSLPRTQELLDAMARMERGESVDQAAYEAQVAGAVKTIVARQAASGIDVVDDGEVGKPGFITYINERRV